MGHLNHNGIDLQVVLYCPATGDRLVQRWTLGELASGLDLVARCGYRVECLAQPDNDDTTEDAEDALIESTQSDTVDITEEEMERLSGYDDARLDEVIQSDKVINGVMADLTGLGGAMRATMDNLSGVSGNLDECGLSREDRERGVDVDNLILFASD